MEMLEMILIVLSLATWACFGIVLLISTIMSAVYDARHEKREKEAAGHDLELHNARMNDLLK